MANFVPFVDAGSEYDPFNSDVPSFDQVLAQVKLEERIEQDKIHSTSPPNKVEKIQQSLKPRACCHRFGQG